MIAITPRLFVIALLVLPTFGAPAQTAQARDKLSEYQTDEVTLRLVAGEAQADGSLRAALLVDLAPGWKTYWIDPGEAGIAPSIDLAASSNVAAATPAFPVPHRFKEGSAASVGYSQPVAFALDLQQAVPGEPTTIRARVLLGVCQDVCIPVSAELVREDRRPAAAEERLVETAFALLPDESTAEHGIHAASLYTDGRALRVEARVPLTRASQKADLFVAGPSGWSFGPPRRETRTGSTIVFEVPVLASPKVSGEPRPLLIDAIMTVGASAYRVSALGTDSRH